MTKEELTKIITDFVATHQRFPTKKDIPDLPSLRQLQRNGIFISDFIEGKKTSQERIDQMRSSTQKINEQIWEIASALKEKGYVINLFKKISRTNTSIINIICEKDKSLFALELFNPANKFSVPTSLKRKLYKFPYDVLESFSVVYLVNINPELDITYYKPRIKPSQKIKIINLAELPL